MDTKIKALAILFVASLMVLLLTGCSNPPWESGTVLSVKVDTPRDGTTVTTSTVPVSGRLLGSQKTAAKVTINGADVPVKDAKFSTILTLTEGVNVITIVATSGEATPNRKVTVTYARPKS